MKKIEDKVFGNLRYDCNWEKVYPITMFGIKEDVILYVSGQEDEEIEDAQRNAFIYFETNKGEIIREVEEKLLDYYKKNYQKNYDYLSETISIEEIEEVLPKVSRVEELGKIMQVTAIKFPYSFGYEANAVNIIIGCEWKDEEECGVGVQIENGEIVIVDSWDTVF